MRGPTARQCVIAAAIAGALAAPTSVAQRRPATDAEAMTYIFSAFITQADPGVMSKGVRLGPELEQQLALSAGADRQKVYEALVDLTGEKFDVRKATPEEIAAYGARRGFDPASRNPLFTLEAGERRFLLQYDPRALNVAFVGQLGVPDPEAKRIEPIAAAGRTAAERKPEPPKPLTMAWSTHFGFAQAALAPEGRAAIDEEVLPKLKRLGEIRYIHVNGHADRMGSAEYNQRLSEQRAEAVRAYLVVQGVPADRIEVYSYGKTLPVRACPDQRQRRALIECLAPNRRVTVEVEGLPAAPEVEAAVRK